MDSAVITPNQKVGTNQILDNLGGPAAVATSETRQRMNAQIGPLLRRREKTKHVPGMGMDIQRGLDSLVHINPVQFRLHEIRRRGSRLDGEERTVKRAGGNVEDDGIAVEADFLKVLTDEIALPSVRDNPAPPTRKGLGRRAVPKGGAVIAAIQKSLPKTPRPVPDTRPDKPHPAIGESGNRDEPATTPPAEIRKGAIPGGIEELGDTPINRGDQIHVGQEIVKQGGGCGP